MGDSSDILAQTAVKDCVASLCQEHDLFVGHHYENYQYGGHMQPCKPRRLNPHVDRREMIAVRTA